MSTKPVAENSRSQGQSERRTRPRYALVTSIRAHAKCPDRVIRSQGMTVEISEGGVSAYLRGEFEAGQQVELELDLPTGPLELSAIVKNCLGAPLRFSIPGTSSRTMSENSGELQRRTAVSVEPASGIGDTFGPKTAAPQRTP